MHTVCVIQHVMQPSLYWQRGVGWTDAKDATEFELNDTHKLPLPPQGKWVRFEEPTIPRKSA